MTTTYAIENTSRVADLLDGKTTEIVIKTAQANTAFAEADLDKVSVSALLNTEDDFQALAGRLTGMAGEYNVPPPIWETTLGIDLYQDLKPGSMVSITWADAPANPFTGVRGWSAVIGRVVRRALSLSGRFGVQVSIELLSALTVGRVAPACEVYSKGSDGNGAYFVCTGGTVGDNCQFVADSDDRDWYYFAVGDLLDLRDTDGSTRPGWTVRAITGFGTNFVSDPLLANSDRIYVDGAIAPVISTNHYITLAAWSAVNTTRMELYSAYASAAGVLTPADPAKRYGA